jgi:hypothetical protein
VVPPHQFVPARLLVRAHRAHLHLAQSNRGSPHCLRYRIQQSYLSSPLPNLFAD